MSTKTYIRPEDWPKLFEAAKKSIDVESMQEEFRHMLNQEQSRLKMEEAILVAKAKAEGQKVLDWFKKMAKIVNDNSHVVEYDHGEHGSRQVIWISVEADKVHFEFAHDYDGMGSHEFYSGQVRSGGAIMQAEYFIDTFRRRFSVRKYKIVATEQTVELP